MMDFEKARRMMVDCQVRTNDVTEHTILKALLEVPREEFLENGMKQLAYIDDDLMIAEGRYLMEPAPFAKLLQIAKIDSDDVVLVVGTGCGYSSAVISQMASSVVALEQNEDLASVASARLSDLGFDTVAVVTGDHQAGFAKEAPYDVIFIDGAIEEMSQHLLDQLAENGRMIAVEGTGNAAMASVYEKFDGIVSARPILNCAIKPLPGFDKKRDFIF